MKEEVLVVKKVSILIIMCLLLTGCFKKYNVEFDTNGGYSLSSQKVKENGYVTKPNDPYRPDYNFLGWYLNGEEYDFSKPVTSNLLLVAKWESTKKEEKEESISLNTHELSLNLNDTYLLSVISSLIEEQSLIWTSSDENIVTVDNGLVKGMNLGTAIITVSTYDGKYNDTCLVTVMEKQTEEEPPKEEGNVPVTKVTISGKTKGYVNEEVTFRANITPKEATNKEVIWQSTKEDIATINENGILKALKVGKTVIKVTTVDGNLEASIVFEVLPLEEEKPENVPEENIPEEALPEEPKEEVPEEERHIEGQKEIAVGEEITLKIVPSLDEEIIWQSSNEEIATVSNTGLVKALKEGTVTISAKFKNMEKELTITITVNP